MIPILTTMVALLIVTVCSDLVRREQARVGDVTFVSFLAIITIVAAIGGTAYTWRQSVEMGRDMAEAQRQMEQLWP